MEKVWYLVGPSLQTKLVVHCIVLQKLRDLPCYQTPEIIIVIEYKYLFQNIQTTIFLNIGLCLLFLASATLRSKIIHVVLWFICDMESIFYKLDILHLQLT